MLIKIEAIVREEKMEDVKAALNEIQVNGFTVTQIMGCGTQRGYTEYVRGSKIDVFLKPKIKFEIVVSSEDWEIKVIDAIQKATLFVSVQVRPDTMRCSRSSCKIIKM